MRVVVDSLVALMLAGILAGIVMKHRAEDDAEARVERTRESVQWLARQLALQAALGKVTLNDRGHPMTVDPAWFEPSLPENQLVGTAHPWLEVAGPLDKDLEHPRERVATDRSLARFWYNPSIGVVRARVAPCVSDAETIATYERVNGCVLGGR